MTGARVLPALALALLIAGCGTFGQQAGGGGSTTAPRSTGAGSSSPPAGTSTAGPSSSTTAHDGEGDGQAPPFPADARPDLGRASADARGTITAVRIGHHDGYDRVVFEFHGAGTPGWTVRYVPAATGQASGRPIDIPGNAVLSVAITGVGNPTDTGIAEVPRGAVTAAGTDVVTQVYFDGTFEGISQAFIGTTAVRPFRVFLLTAPARVVVDVREH